jgi:SAM-dependent methyltransferase
MSKLPEHVARNRAYWDDLARHYIEAGERAWAQDEPTWGIWQVPEAEVQVLSEELAGKDAIELGCGTAYISAWLSRRGARVVGIDNSEVQLGTARRLQRQYGLDFPLIHGDAESIAYRTRASTSRFLNMAPACGQILSDGFLRPRACCVQAAS